MIVMVGLYVLLSDCLESIGKSGKEDKNIAFVLLFLYNEIIKKGKYSKENM